VSRLPDIQEAFQRFLLDGDPEISSHVVGTERVPVQTRLDIYGGGYRARLAEALEASFPVLAHLLGEADFHTLAWKYIAAHESTFFSIRYYGDRMAEFLAAESEYAKAPLLAELARWEWAMADAFDAADDAPVDTDAIAQVAPEEWAGLCFDWSPSVRVLQLEWNVPEIWKAVTEGGSGASRAAAADADVAGGAQTGAAQADTDAVASPPEPRLEPASWLIWRRDLQIYFRELSAEEAAAIVASRAGQSFGELCVALCEHLDEAEAPGHAAGFLRGWVQSALIVGFRV
jgi:hypothetical protein